jgi:hypothetical protein
MEYGRCNPLGKFGKGFQLTSLTLSQDPKDPLGCAIYKTFGIGLGFFFDHMTPPADETKPSTRQLQARAAKSAQKRAVELFDAEGAQKELDLVEDLDLRHKRKKEMRQQTQQELDYMARRLTALIPRCGSLAGIDQEQVLPLYGKLLAIKERSSSVQQLLRDHKQNDKTEDWEVLTQLFPMGSH